MGKIEKELKAFLTKNEKNTYADSESLKEFEKSAKEFQTLIDSGIAKSRGYNLLTIESKEYTVGFNSVQYT